MSAHFQNGIVETNIDFLQQSTRSILLHAIRNWHEMIALELWTVALLEATRFGNLTRFDSDGRAPIAHFSRSDAIFHLNDEHAFGCPVCVLDESLQAGNSIPKWNPRARVGACVGKSSFHAQSVSLIMNTQTGLIAHNTIACAMITLRLLTLLDKESHRQIGTNSSKPPFQNHHLLISFLHLNGTCCLMLNLNLMLHLLHLYVVLV